MTIPLENLADGSISDRNFQTLARLVLETGGRSVGIRWGTDTVTWAGGSPFSGAKAVTHGLGRTPVVAISGDAGGGTLATGIPVFSSNGLGATTFNVAAQTNDSSSPVAGITRTFYWIAVG